jgi:hypothetical protein
MPGVNRWFFIPHLLSLCIPCASVHAQVPVAEFTTTAIIFSQTLASAGAVV